MFKYLLWTKQHDNDDTQIEKLVKISTNTFFDQFQVAH